jgi:dolichol kinase
VKATIRGENLSDIVTQFENRRRYGSLKWPFSEKKSYVGSAAFVVSAFAVCAVLLSYLSATGCLVGFDVLSKLPQLLLISVLCALVELVPIGELAAKSSISFYRVFLRYISCYIVSLLFLPIIFNCTGDDNVSVPLAAAALSWALL